MKGSLRSRLLVGAVVWMGAVLLVLSVQLVAIIRNHPEHTKGAVAYFATIGGVGFAFIIWGWFLVRKALAPLGPLRSGLASVREGRSQGVAGDYPEEVQPLVDDLNALLEDRERAIGRALTTAGDLAHGLKTQLTVLAHEAELADAIGHHDLAATLHQAVERIRRQVDYHLARSRAGASAGTAPGLRCSVLASVEGLVRTMRRLHAARDLAIETEVSAEHEIRGRREDLDEMLGNLLDNACRWAGSRVELSSSSVEAGILIAVDDDGPGLEPSQRARMLERGVRADESLGGSGLGLAIVSDLAELHGGSVTLEASPLGGTRARLQLPRA